VVPAPVWGRGRTALSGLPEGTGWCSSTDAPLRFRTSGGAGRLDGKGSMRECREAVG